MSTTHYSPSRSAMASELYVRGEDDERGVAITCDVPGGPGAFARRAQALTQDTQREVEALHYRQSFQDRAHDPRTGFDPDNPEDRQRANDLGYWLGKKMFPNSDLLVVTHIDGKGRKVHNHILVVNHDNDTGRALNNFRTHKSRPELGRQRGVQWANDQLMREHGLPVVTMPKIRPKEWELRRENFAADSIERDMGDRMEEALCDPRSVDRAGLEAVIAEQNERSGDDGQRVPHMRLHATVSRKGKNAGKETWSLYMEDRRQGGKRTERRHRASVLSAEFTREGAQEFFEYNEQKKRENEHREQLTGQAEGTRHAGEAAPQQPDLEAQLAAIAGVDAAREPSRSTARGAGHRTVDAAHVGRDQEGDRDDGDLTEINHGLRRRLQRQEQARRDREDAEAAAQESAAAVRDAAPDASDAQRQQDREPRRRPRRQLASELVDSGRAAGRDAGDDGPDLGL